MLHSATAGRHCSSRGTRTCHAPGPRCCPGTLGSAPYRTRPTYVRSVLSRGCSYRCSRLVTWDVTCGRQAENHNLTCPCIWEAKLRMLVVQGGGTPASCLRGNLAHIGPHLGSLKHMSRPLSTCCFAPVQVRCHCLSHTSSTSPDHCLLALRSATSLSRQGPTKDFTTNASSLVSPRVA